MLDAFATTSDVRPFVSLPETIGLTKIRAKPRLDDSTSTAPMRRPSRISNGSPHPAQGLCTGITHIWRVWERCRTG